MENKLIDNVFVSTNKKVLTNNRTLISLGFCY